MFEKIQPTQADLFKSISHQVSVRKSKILEDPAGWHNVFYDEVTRQIDEDVFSVLDHKGNGRPNASIRKMVAMMILKEGNCWGDHQDLADGPLEGQAIRANVEASIHQIYQRLGKNEKVRCRTRYKSHCNVLYRAMWTNFRRIQKKTTENSPVFDFWALWRSVRAHVLNWFDGQGMFFVYNIYSPRLA